MKEQLNYDEELLPLYRYSVDLQEWQYLDTEYGWTIVSSKEDAKECALHSAIVMGLQYYNDLACASEPVSTRVPEYAKPPELVVFPPPPPLRKVKDFSLANGEVWVIIAFVLGMAICGIISKYSSACV